MASNDRLADPTDLDGLREALAASDPEGRLAPIGMKRIEIGPDVLDLLPEAVSGLLAGDGERVVLVGAPVHELHANEEALDEAEAAVSGADRMVMVGSGIISDVCKVATSRARGIPLE